MPQVVPPINTLVVDGGETGDITSTGMTEVAQDHLKRFMPQAPPLFVVPLGAGIEKEARQKLEDYVKEYI